MRISFTAARMMWPGKAPQGKLSWIPGQKLSKQRLTTLPPRQCAHQNRWAPLGELFVIKITARTETLHRKHNNNNKNNKKNTTNKKTTQTKQFLCIWCTALVVLFGFDLSENVSRMQNSSRFYWKLKTQWLYSKQLASILITTNRVRELMRMTMQCV